MNLIRLGPVILSLACTGLAYPQNNQMVKDENQPEKIRTYATQRLVTAKPVIDGKLDDACWETGEWAGKLQRPVRIAWCRKGRRPDCVD